MIQLAPHFAAFLLSFLVIGALWANHHTLFTLVGHYSPKMIWPKPAPAARGRDATLHNRTDGDGFARLYPIRNVLRSMILGLANSQIFEVSLEARIHQKRAGEIMS